MLDQDIATKLASRGREVFIRPTTVYTWNEIINGCVVYGKSKSQRAVSANTWRRLHRKDNTSMGPSKVFVLYFNDKKKQLLNALADINCLDDYHAMLNDVRQDLLPQLNNHIKQNIIASYNAVRKPIDLYLEHLVAMAKELNEHREKLVPFLSLPLDSYMMASPDCFEDKELKRNDIQRGDGYPHVRTEAAYIDLQQALRGRCDMLSDMTGADVYPIFLDLLWGQRLFRLGNNLFETNP